MAVALLSWAAAAAGAVNSPSLADSALARQVLADARFQRQLSEPPPDPWAFLNRDFKLPFLELELPAWAPFAALVLLALSFATPRWLRLRALREGAVQGQDPMRRSAAPTRTLAQAQELADRGAYPDAVHWLLLVALEQWSVTSGTVTTDLTSREVVRTLPADLPADRRHAFVALVRSVEQAWFGGRTVDHEAFEHALRHFHAFTGLRA